PSAEPQHRYKALNHSTSTTQDEPELVPPNQHATGGMASALAAFYAAVRRASAQIHSTQPQH
ncbi:hypothetical protein, partial [Lentimonas sp. CC21]